MSRTLILSLAAAATITVASFACSASYARGFGGGGHFAGGGHANFGGRVGGGHSGGGHVGGGRTRLAGDGGRTLTPINPGRPGRPGFPGHPGHWGFNHHGHFVFRGGRWIVLDGPVGEAAIDEVPVAAPGPCTCLTKTYTPDGLVVFADVCTKEAASARLDGPAANATPALSSSSAPTDDKAADAQQAPTSTNYAGRTYADYLAANSQAASEAPPKN